MTIPKVIHYCWFGRNPKPELAKKCIASWRKFFPDYEIKEWNEDNFNVNIIPYASEAYAAKKYAFVSDYARFWILYNFGGIYFDTDVEVIRPMADILEGGAFLGAGDDSRDDSCLGLTVAPGLGLGLGAGVSWCDDVLNLYQRLHFLNRDGSCNYRNVVDIVTDYMFKEGFDLSDGKVYFKGARVYPEEYFNPKKPDGRIVLTENTRTIHHFAGSWHTPREELVIWVNRKFGRTVAMVIGLLTRNPLTIPARVWKYMTKGY